MEPISGYEDRIVAFVDILGFGHLVESLSTSPQLHQELHRALMQIQAVREHSIRLDTVSFGTEVSVFSDSIVISANDHSLLGVVWVCGYLQASLLKLGILARGGISRGLTFHQDDVLYGEGMLKAYRLESSSAVYPRIVLDPDILQLLSSGSQKKLLDKDMDGLWFVDPFKFDEVADGAEELASDGWDPRQIYFNELGKRIEKGIQDASQLDHIAKWSWLERRYHMAMAAEGYDSNAATR